MLFVSGVTVHCQTFYGMGPYRVHREAPNVVTTNEYTWLRDNHLLFLDNPCGVGFSTVDPMHAARDQSTVAVQLYAAVQGFMRLHPEYADCPLYLFGESYGGKYVPLFAAYIESVQTSGNAGPPALNLKGAVVHAICFFRGAVLLL